ncbi:ArsC family reductase [Sphingomonas qomolangmaensis]|uniref:ArsC family reductase n=1 Tax=Sphingomonas qomolangmaensis TaxID=2918765 RepID=A0ABY5L2T0_9SPHN|nr:ArsC family reductase [Sphingomonas qomolangmaensis]UUL81250.1 ArsC family reductase [Sphingomonas qomolangmaensis]
MTTTLYGIPNCDTVKKARAWLAEHGVAYHFHDYKKQGVDAARLAKWSEQVGWERLVNRAGTTFRKLPDADKAVADADAAIALMVANPSLIKRPVVEYPGGLLVGYSPEGFAAALG